MTATGTHDTGELLRYACRQAGLDADGAEPIRLGENAIFRLPGGIVARISRPGQQDAARREVRIAQWLADHDIPAVRALDGLDQPVQAYGRAVTFWHELPDHHNGTPGQVAQILRRLHELPLTEGHPFSDLDPFVRLDERITAATSLTEDDRAWLRQHLATMRDRYEHLPVGLPHTVLHGDAWVGNVAATNEGQVVLLDLERASIGPPEWDLVSTAIKHTSFAWISADEYRDFCHRYGHDVTTWDGFEVLRDIRELRMTCYLAQHAAENPNARSEAALRVACLRGKHGSRPWSWSPAS
ncbi:phosphotransferase enzyme family protein [Amycolatopsis thermoflava]|uniref:phosphotransferase enzyme family protein n=1 Tax=Amycolatopsis thermoflava TaxID=84480 RepID=UPI003F4A1B74